jgi:hypothetical protein
VEAGDTLQIYWTGERTWYEAEVLDVFPEVDARGLCRWCVLVLYPETAEGEDSELHQYLDGGRDAVKWRKAGEAARRAV